MSIAIWETSKLLATGDDMKELFMDIATTGTSDKYFIDDYMVESDQEKYLGFATYSWAGIVGKSLVNDYPKDYAILVCDIVPPKVKADCLKGVFDGAFTSSIPTKEYVDFDLLCSSNVLDEEERKVCYSKYQNEFKTVYSSNEREKFCSIIPSEYKEEEICIK